VPAFDQLAVTADSHPLPLSMYVRQLSFLVFRARDMSWLSMVRGVGLPHRFTSKCLSLAPADGVHERRWFATLAAHVNPKLETINDNPCQFKSR
jgi:hypothetical protein